VIDSQGQSAVRAVWTLGEKVVPKKGCPVIMDTWPLTGYYKLFSMHLYTKLVLRMTGRRSAR